MAEEGEGVAEEQNCQQPLEVTPSASPTPNSIYTRAGEA